MKHFTILRCTELETLVELRIAAYYKGILEMSIAPNRSLPRTTKYNAVQVEVKLHGFAVLPVKDQKPQRKSANTSQFRI